MEWPRLQFKCVPIKCLQSPDSTVLVYELTLYTILLRLICCILALTTVRKLHISISQGSPSSWASSHDTNRRRHPIFFPLLLLFSLPAATFFSRRRISRFRLTVTSSTDHLDPICCSNWKSNFHRAARFSQSHYNLVVLPVFESIIPLNLGSIHQSW